MDTKTLLKKRIEADFERLEKLKPGTEEHKATAEELSTLITHESELARRKEERISGWIRDGIAVLGILVPCGVTIWGTLKTLKFETEGTVTSLIGKGFVNKLLPKK